jgi:hypothetical protein
MSNNTIKEVSFNLHWYGPHDSYDVSKFKGEAISNCVLYMLCGTHGRYGKKCPPVYWPDREKLEASNCRAQQMDQPRG